MIYDYVSIDGRPITDEMKAAFRTRH
jgi:hypothetical protein